MVRKLTFSDKHPFEWIDLENPTIEELDDVVKQYNLQQSAVQDCLDPTHLPKYEEMEEVVFIVSRVYDPLSKPEDDTIQEVSRKISVFISRPYLITVHRSEQSLVSNLFAKYEAKGKCPDSSHILYQLLNGVLLSYIPPAERLSEEIDFYESKIFLKNRIPDLLKSLYRIKRRIYVIKRIITLSEDIVNKLEGKQHKNPVFRELQDTYLRLDTIYDQLTEEINTLMSLYLSISSQKTNEVIRVLTIFSVFFMPLTFVVGIYGMNFQNIPELYWKWGYVYSILLMLVVTLVIYFWFKRKKWL